MDFRTQLEPGYVDNEDVEEELWDRHCDTQSDVENIVEIIKSFNYFCLANRNVHKKIMELSLELNSKIGKIIGNVKLQRDAHIKNN